MHIRFIGVLNSGKSFDKALCLCNYFLAKNRFLISTYVKNPDTQANKKLTKVSINNCPENKDQAVNTNMPTVVIAVKTLIKIDIKLSMIFSFTIPYTNYELSLTQGVLTLLIFFFIDNFIFVPIINELIPIL
jgi:hypothetical protein